MSERATAIAACFDACLGDDAALARTPVQHIHGDLHVGQVLRAGETAVRSSTSTATRSLRSHGVVQPAARDVAQLARSLDHVGHVVLHRDPRAGPRRGGRDGWSAARADFLTAYRGALQDHAMSSLLDDRLLPAFEVEQELRELVYADRHLPEWAYAPQAALRDLVPADGG